MQNTPLSTPRPLPPERIRALLRRDPLSSSCKSGFLFGTASKSPTLPWEDMSRRFGVPRTRTIPQQPRGCLISSCLFSCCAPKPKSRSLIPEASRAHMEEREQVLTLIHTYSENWVLECLSCAVGLETRSGDSFVGIDVFLSCFCVLIGWSWITWSIWCSWSSCKWCLNKITLQKSN